MEMSVILMRISRREGQGRDAHGGAILLGEVAQHLATIHITCCA